MQGDFSLAFSSIETVLLESVSVSDFREIELCMRIMFVGSLWGFENIHQILESRGIGSDSLYKHRGI